MNVRMVVRRRRRGCGRAVGNRRHLGPRVAKVLRHFGRATGVAADAEDQQHIVGLQFGVEGVDPALEVAERLQVREDDIDLDGDLGLELGEVDMAAMKRARIAGGLPEAVDQRVDERAAVGMIAVGIAGDEASDG